MSECVCVCMYVCVCVSDSVCVCDGYVSVRCVCMCVSVCVSGVFLQESRSGQSVMPVSPASRSGGAGYYTGRYGSVAV